MLKKISIDRKPNGNKIIIPLDVTDENIDQQVKMFIEIADDNPFDGQLHIAHFRVYHRKEKTIEVLRRILHELNQPTIELEIHSQRKDLLPFFEAQLSRHTALQDSESGYPGDRSRLPI
jgi:hypothetical protein